MYAVEFFESRRGAVGPYRFCVVAGGEVVGTDFDGFESEHMARAEYRRFKAALEAGVTLIDERPAAVRRNRPIDGPIVTGVVAFRDDDETMVWQARAGGEVVGVGGGAKHRDGDGVTDEITACREAVAVVRGVE